MATATPAQQSAIVDLYVALFNRAPDASGFEFWTQALADGASLSDVTGSFFVSPETTALYPASQTAQQFVSAFYQTVFGRTADAGGLAFWTGVLESAGGVTSAAARALLVSKIVDLVSTPLTEKPADLTDAQYAETQGDRTLFGKKSAAALDFAINVKSDDLSAAKQALVDAAAPTTPTTPPAPAGETFTLTTGDDVKTTGAGNDTFNAPLVDMFVPTLGSDDVLDGGAGDDTLNVVLSYSNYVVPTLKNIELINVQSLSYGILDLANATGVKKVGFDASSGPGTIYNVGDAALFVSNQSAYASFQGSTAETLSLTLSKVGRAGNSTDIYVGFESADLNLIQSVATASYDIVATDAAVALNRQDMHRQVQNVTVKAAGTNAITFDNADAATMKQLTVTGSGSVDFSGTPFSTSLTKFTGSTGDDSIAFTDAPLAGAVINGGGGRDTFGVTVAGYAALEAAVQEDRPTITNFEVLKITDALDGATIDASVLPGITGVVLGGGLSTDLTERGFGTVSKLGANATVELQGGVNQDSSELTLQMATDTSNDVLTLVLNTHFVQSNDGDSKEVTVQPDIEHIETLNIVSTATPSNLGGETPDTLSYRLTLSNQDDLTTLRISGDRDFSYSVSGSSNHLTTVDASALTARASIRLTNMDASLPTVTLKGSATAENDLRLYRDAADVITGGAKSDYIQGGGGADTLTGGGGNDRFLVYGGGDTSEVNAAKITDFNANTAGGAAGTGAAEVGQRNGDVLSVGSDGGPIKVFNDLQDSTEALAALQTLKNNATSYEFGAALTKSGMLYMSSDDGNSITSIIELTGVTTITEAAFELLMG